ncbi:MAG: LEA type 2 family protein [Candidatus Aminicenantales bacterium]
MSRKRHLQTVLALLLAAAAAAAGQKADLEVSLREKHADAPTLQGVTLVFVLDIRNNTGAVESLSRYDYRLVVGQTEYIKLETNMDEPIAVPAKGGTSIALPVKFTYEYLYASVAEAAGKDRVDCHLVGGMTFQDERKREKKIPIAFSGDFPIFKGFNAGSEGFEARDLTMGGADITYKGVLRNPNGFELRPRKLTYKVLIGDKPIAEGTLTGLAPIPEHGEIGFSVPLLLDFWENGKDVFQALDNPPVPVRLEGELEADWDWGILRLPFAQSDKAPVVKK